MEVTLGETTKHYRTIWLEEGLVKLINQPLLPHKFEILGLANYQETARAIKEMKVRGAGAIGAAAGFALAQAVQAAPEENFQAFVEEARKEIEATRPTAQNLFYATEKVFNALQKINSTTEKRKVAVQTAQTIADEDAENCRLIGQNGEKLIHNNMSVLTHCNAGWLAFVDWGTALAPVFAAKRQGKKVFVFVDETRPRCQGARLTAWELLQEKIGFAIIADNAAGYFMKEGKVGLVITGADRIAVNGDTANKIGTYEKAVLAKENGIPFYVAAPTTTIDLNCPSGANIPIEERGQEEVLSMWGQNKDAIESVRLAPAKAKARNPAFDVTPAKYIAGIITEKGIVKASEKAIKSLFQ